MKITSWAWLSSILMLAVSCTNQAEPGKKDYIITEKDIVPEGVAFDSSTQTIYISSCYKRKIVAISKDGDTRDFITEGQDDIKSVIGMEVDAKRNCLWAVSSEANDVLPLKGAGSMEWRSSVFQFNLSDGKLIKQYKLDKDSVFLNDLTVGSDGTVYVTESVGNTVYSMKPGADSLEFFIKLSPSQFVNGLGFTDKPGILFVCSDKGIYSIDVGTKKYFLLPSVSPDASGIDGLAFHKNYFIAHPSASIVRLYLSDNRDSIIRADTIDSGPEFDISTTGEVSGNYYYYIVNSQVQSAFDFANKTIKPMDSLENVIIRRKKL